MTESKIAIFLGVGAAMTAALLPDNIFFEVDNGITSLLRYVFILLLFLLIGAIIFVSKKRK